MRQRILFSGFWTLLVSSALWAQEPEDTALVPDALQNHYYEALKQKGIEIIDEIEFASNFTNAKIIAITGSNGKTTTTRLIYHILENALKRWKTVLAYRSRC